MSKEILHYLLAPACFSIATINRKNQRETSFDYIHYNLSDLQFVCVYLLPQHTVAEGKTHKQQLRGTMLTPAQQLMENRLWYSELFQEY